MAKLTITCMDGRKFLRESAYRTHVQKVHAKDLLLFAKFDLKDGDKSQVTVGVPYRAPTDAGSSNVDYEKDSCEDCNANSSAGRLPVHPGCECTPSGGWDAYIKSLDRPEDTSEDLWNDFLKFLDEAKQPKERS